MAKVLIILSVLSGMYLCYLMGKVEVHKEWYSWMQQLEKKLRGEEKGNADER